MKITVDVTFICPECHHDTAHSDNLKTWYCNYCGATSASGPPSLTPPGRGA